MTNKRTAAFIAETLAVFLLFVSSGEAELPGFVVSDSSKFDPLPEINYLQDPTSPELKKKIVSALKTLSIDGTQSCLVQYWAATNAGKTHLLATKDQPFGIHGNDKELDLYHKACLHHKLYVHREGRISFGLPGHTFEDKTPHQTQDMHYYPEDQRPPCEDNAIFTKKWGSFAVPVILASECIGVLEFVHTEPTHTYEGDINEVNKALKCAGFESFNIRDTRKDEHIPNKRRRKTNSSMYEHYNVLAPYFGLSKAEAMKRVSCKFFPKKQTETTSENTHIRDCSAGKAKKVKKEFEVIESTFTNALRNVGITEWPFLRKTTSKASCSPKTRINPMTSAATSFRSLNADDLPSCFVQGEAFQRSLERTSVTNASVLQPQNDQIVSYHNTSYTRALPEFEYAHPFLPEGNRVDDDYSSPRQEIPDMSESRLAETLCDETSSIGIPDNAGALKSGWIQEAEWSRERTTTTDISSLETRNDQIVSCSTTSYPEALPKSEYARRNFLPEGNRFECQDNITTYLNQSVVNNDCFTEDDFLFLNPEIHDSSETRTDQTLCDGTSSFGILNDASFGFNSSRDKGVYETSTTSTSASGVHQSSSACLEQSCETRDGLFLNELIDQDLLIQEELECGLSYTPTN